MKIRITSGHGEAVPGGYNGSLIAEHDGRPVGSIEYQTATGQRGFKIAMLKIVPGYQGRGIGTGLLQATMREAPGPVDPGWMTDQGYRWWQERGESVAKHYDPPAWTPELPELNVPDEPEAHADVPEPEFEVEL